MFDFFRTKKLSPQEFLGKLGTDLHSHLIPGIDDGVNDLEESLAIAREFEKIGYQHLITTPHIYNGVYDNTEQSILKEFERVKNYYKEQGLGLKLSIAAEYYIDEIFLEKIQKNEQFLTFGNNLILLETGFYDPPLIFEEVIFLLKSRSITPIFAHPERYIYLQKKPELAKSYLEKGLVFQLNFLSLSGYYSSLAQKTAFNCLESGYYSLIGSDCHKLSQFPFLLDPIPEKILDLLHRSPFSNSSLK